MCQGQEAMREVRRRGIKASGLRSDKGWVLQVLPVKRHPHPLRPFVLSHLGTYPRVSGILPPPQ